MMNDNQKVHSYTTYDKFCNGKYLLGVKNKTNVQLIPYYKVIHDSEVPMISADSKVSNMISSG